MHKPTIVDIETYGLPEAVALLPEPGAPENYKDPVKIAAYIEDAKRKRLEKAALDPDCCRIVVLGWQQDGTITTLQARDEAAEKAALERFWREAWDATLIGFAIFHFDLRVLIRRSQYLGVAVPYINLDKYRTPYVDLQQLLLFNGPNIEGHTLDFYCQRFSIDVEDIANGAEIAGLVTAASLPGASPAGVDALWRVIEDHCRADLTRAARLAQRLGVLPGEPPILRGHDVVTEQAF